MKHWGGMYAMRLVSFESALREAEGGCAGEDEGCAGEDEDSAGARLPHRLLPAKSP